MVEMSIRGAETQGERSDISESPRRATKKGKETQAFRRIGTFLKDIRDRVLRPSAPVLLSDEYRKYTGGEEYMNGRDFRFFKGIVRKYFSSSKGNQSELDRESKFFSAVSAVTERCMELDGVTDEDKYKRIKVLSTLFLHHNKIRPIFQQIHAQKMVSAFPDFRQQLATTTLGNIDSLDAYFDRVIDPIMVRTFTTASEDLYPVQDKDKNRNIVNLGKLMWVQQATDELNAPDPVQRHSFATIGITTNLRIVKAILSHAVVHGRDVDEALRTEFLTRDGVAFQFMRTHLQDFVGDDSIATELEKGGFAALKPLLTSKDFIAGACPAILKMKADDGTEASRPIAYEYAVRMFKNLQEKRPDLLRSR